MLWTVHPSAARPLGSLQSAKSRKSAWLLVESGLDTGAFGALADNVTMLAVAAGRQIIQDLCSTDSPFKQKQTIERYFHPDAGFNHPLCRIAQGHNSRNGIQGIYSWYKQLSPKIPPLEISSIAFDEANSRLYVDVRQLFTLWAVPWRTVPMRLVVVLTLLKDESNGLYLIKQQEDFYHPEVILSVGTPGAHYVISVLKAAAGYLCGVGARAGNLIGWWVPEDCDNRSSRGKEL